MFLAQRATLKDIPPIYPYPPPGTTAIEDLDLDVRVHAHCPGRHGLRYENITWGLADGTKTVQEAQGGRVIGRTRAAAHGSLTPTDMSVPVDFAGLDRERDLSEKVTRNIFVWMRETEGFPPAERDIYRHEWIDLSDDDDDDSLHPEGGGLSTAGRNVPVRVGGWIASAITARSNSI